LANDAEQSLETTSDWTKGGWFWPVLGLAVVGSFPYYFSLETFFSHDDFAILWFHKDWPLWKPWVFLRPEVLTFYRPLQSYIFALLFHLFDTVPFPFCFTLVAIHLANVVLFGRMTDRIFKDRSLTFLSVIFYATDWQYCDVVFWKGNLGTALSWLFTLACANAFLNHLENRRLRAYLGALAFLVASLLSKETAVNAPLLLSLIFWAKLPGRTETAEAETEPTTGETRRSLFADTLRLLAPFYAITAAYVVFHKAMVRDVYTWLPKGYEFAAPGEAFRAVCHALGWWLTFPLQAGALLLAPTSEQSAIIGWPEQHPFILPLVLVLVVAALRNRRLIFGLAWAVLAFFPANLIPDYHTPRYYYGSVMGIAVIFAELFLAADRTIRQRWSFAVVAATRVIGSLAILAIVYTNMICTTGIVSEDARKCAEIEDLYHYLISQRGKVPPKTLFRVRCLNRIDHFHEGMGLREMFKLALDDDSVEAILPDEHLTTEVLNLLLTEYPPPVEVFRTRSGRFLFRQPTPKPAGETGKRHPRGRLKENPTSPYGRTN